MGSEAGNRYQEFGGINEFESILPIHLVLTFDYANNMITMYRNGFKYGNSYDSKVVIFFPQGACFFYFCIRNPLTVANPTNKNKDQTIKSYLIGDIQMLPNQHGVTLMYIWVQFMIMF